MPKWLIYVLVAVGVFVLIEVVLVLAGKKEWAKKLVKPFTLALAALVALISIFGGGAAAIKAERDRIEEARKKLEQERDKLRRQLAEATKKYEEKVAALQDKIKQSDGRAASLEDRINTMKTEGVKKWVESLSDQQRKKILQGELPPGLPDEFIKSPPDEPGNT